MTDVAFVSRSEVSFRCSFCDNSDARIVGLSEPIDDDPLIVIMPVHACRGCFDEIIKNANYKNR